MFHRTGELQNCTGVFILSITCDLSFFLSLFVCLFVCLFVFWCLLLSYRSCNLIQNIEPTECGRIHRVREGLLRESKSNEY